MTIRTIYADGRMTMSTTSRGSRDRVVRRALRKLRLKDVAAVAVWDGRWPVGFYSAREGT